MKFSLNTKNSIGILLLAGIITVVSCKKDNTEALLPLNNDLAAVSIAYTDTIFGNWANPALGAAGYDTIYFDATTGQSASSPFAGYNVVFYDFNNGIISRADSAHELKYLNTTTALTSISSTAFGTAPVVPGGFGENTSTTYLNNPANANGWWNYERTIRQVLSTRNLIFFYKSNAPGSDIYAFQIIEAWGEGTATLNRGVYRVTGGIATP